MRRIMLNSALILGIFAVIGAGLVGATFEGTKERIADNDREFLMRTMHELVAPGAYDNDPFTDTTTALSQNLLGSKNPVTVYRARKDGKPVAAVIATEAPDGYSGTIKLLVAVDFAGQLGGVRVLSHHETPGLGDAIEAQKSHWIQDFYGRSLSNPDEQGWRVKKDGGVFDQFTGATITPRAVVKAVHKTLKYFEAHRHELFATKTQETPSHG